MKRILIITQKVDRKDSVLGFFHVWIEELSKHFEKITVICLSKGEYNLPDNVRVFSLGKEHSQSKIIYIKNFYRYIWRERNNYEAVFVHMNQEYVLLGGLIWRLMGKRVSMWRNHPDGNFLTNIAAFLCHKVFCTSKYSYTARFKKTKIMPVGIDTETFKVTSNEERKPHSILFLARISPIKKPDLFIEALKILREERENFSASIYGDPLPKDFEFHSSLKEKVRTFGLTDVVHFYPGIPNKETVSVYNKHEIFVNLSPSGMYDKTIFEAAACGAIPLNSNKNLVEEIDNRLIFDENSVESLGAKIKTLLNMAPNELDEIRKEMIDYTLAKHSLKSLGNMLSLEL